MTQVITLRDDDPAVVHEMLLHMYTNSFGNGIGDAFANRGLEMNVKVHDIANKVRERS